MTTGDCITSTPWLSRTVYHFSPFPYFERQNKINKQILQRFIFYHGKSWLIWLSGGRSVYHYVWRTKCATSSYDSTNECTVQYCSTAPTVQYCAYHSLPSSPQIQRARHNYLCTSQLHAKKFDMLPLTVTVAQYDDVWVPSRLHTSPKHASVIHCHNPSYLTHSLLTPSRQYSTVQ
jgi:hypothetical protein